VAKVKAAPTEKPTPIKKRTSQGSGSKVKMSSMNKSRKASFKAYRGQG
jgi:hypothetical protein